MIFLNQEFRSREDQVLEIELTYQEKGDQS